MEVEGATPRSDDALAMARSLLVEIAHSEDAPWLSRAPLPTDTTGRFVCYEATQAAHAANCATCRANRECPVSLALRYCLSAGVHPDDFTPPEEQRPGRFATRLPATPSERKHLRETHARWQQEGVVEWADSEQSGPSPAPAFVTYRRKVRKGKAAEALEWANKHPEQLAAAAEYDSQWPDNLFEAKPRGVYSLKATNASMRKPPMAYPAVSDVAYAASRNDHLIVMDFAEGFTSVRVAPDATRRFHCAVPGSADIRHKCLPFGWRGAPFVFCFLSAVATEVILAECFPPGCSAVVYIDDIAITVPAAIDPAQAAQCKEAAIRRIREMGFRINPDKTQGPATKVEFLGWVIDTADSRGVTVSLPGEKLATCTTWARAARRCRDWPVKSWERLTGRLQHATQFIPGASPHVSELFAAKHHALLSGAKSVRITGTAASALEWVIARMPDAQELRPWEATPLKHAAVLATDASAEGGLGAVIAVAGMAHCVTMSAITDESFAARGNGNSTLLEMLAMEAAIAKTCKIIAARATEEYTQVITLYTDSQAASALLRKGRSADGERNAVIKRIWHHLLQAHALLVPRWIPRDGNFLADALSHPYAPPPAVPTASEFTAHMHSFAAAQTPKY